MELLTRRCRICKFTPGDEEGLYALLASPQVMHFLEPPYSRAQTAAFLARAGLGDPPLIYAVWGRGNRALLGYVIFHPCEEGLWELGWVLSRKYWGLGLARELTAALISYGEARGIPGLLIRCVPEQTATAAIAGDFGFTLLGKRDGLLTFRLLL